MDYDDPARICNLPAVPFDCAVKRRISWDLFRAKDWIESLLVEIMKSDLMAAFRKRLQRGLCYGMVEASRTGVGEDYRDIHRWIFPGQLIYAIGLTPARTQEYIFAGSYIIFLQKKEK
jgi:hypothetical protein